MMLSGRPVRSRGLIPLCQFMRSARAPGGARDLEQYFQGNRTVALVGSSGVGKSTLTNRYWDARRRRRRRSEPTTVAAGIRQPIASCSHDRKVARLSTCPACVGWNSGIRRGSKSNFDDIEALATQCRFRDCRHDSEPGCAVRAAVDRGDLDAARFASYVSLDAHRNAAHGKFLRHTSLQSSGVRRATYGHSGLREALSCRRRPSARGWSAAHAVPLEQWTNRAMDFVAKFEGSDFGAITTDIDCQGLSLGKRQHTIKGNSSRTCSKRSSAWSGARGFIKSSPKRSATRPPILFFL